MNNSVFFGPTPLFSDKFILNHLVYKKGLCVGTNQVVETRPREGLFLAYLTNKLSIESERYVVYKDKKGDVLSKFDLQEAQFID